MHVRYNTYTMYMYSPWHFCGCTPGSWRVRSLRHIQLRSIVVCNPLSQYQGKQLQQRMAATVHVLNRRMLPCRICSLSRHAEMLLLQEHNVETWGWVMSLTKRIVSICIVYTQHIHDIFQNILARISKYYSQYMYSIYTAYTWHIPKTYLVYPNIIVSICIVDTQHIHGIFPNYSWYIQIF